jgi:tryptophan-rich sensory protein
VAGSRPAQGHAAPDEDNVMNRRIESAPKAGPLAGVAALAVFIAVALLAGWIGSLATAPNIPTWYAGLAKPSFNPPNAVFPVVWTILYVVMGVAAWLVWRAPAGESRRLALTAWFVQLVLNVLWSFAFFAARSPLAGLIVIVVLLAAIVVTILAFRRLNGIAALLLAPYLAWVAFAAVLNASILSLNA